MVKDFLDLNQNQKSSSVPKFSTWVNTSSGRFFWALGIHLHILAQIETGKREEQQRKGVGQELVAAGLEWAPYLLMQKAALASCFYRLLISGNNLQLVFLSFVYSCIF